MAITSTGDAPEIGKHVGELELRLSECADNWPDEFFLFVSRVTPLINVDLLVQDDRKGTLLTWRSDRFHGPGWHVPGGIIRFKETAAERIRHVAEKELRSTVEFEPAPALVHESIAEDRDDRGHFISLLYRCRLTGELDPQMRYRADAPQPDQWAWHVGPPPDLIAEQAAYAAFMR